MPITPDPPFPKGRGDVIRSKDWNDAITEVQRLDTAKVNKVGDAIGGTLTIAGHVGIGTTTPENSESWDRVLDVLGGQHAKLSVRSGAIEGRLMAHAGIWGAPAGVVVGTQTNHALSLGTNRVSRLTIDAAGQVGIGIQPQARLHVAGGQSDPGVTEGDVKVGDANFRLKIGVAVSGAGAGDARIRAHGGTNRLLLGSGTSDALTVLGANVGIGTINPSTADRLDVAGSLRVLTGGNPIRITSTWSDFPNAAINQAEISNDTGAFKTLMIVGNRSAGLSGPGPGRRVSVWDILEVNGTLRVADFDMFLRGGIDSLHGLGWYGPSAGGAYPKSFGGFAPDGPVLYGHQGGYLGSTAGGQRIVMTWRANGNVGVGTTNPLGLFHVNGVAMKPGGGSWSVPSDRALKKNVHPLKGVLERLLRLRGVTYEWRQPEEQGGLTGPQVGLIAQEVEEIFPEWVDTMPDGQKLLTVRGFEALAIEAFRELRAEVDGLRQQNEALEARVRALESG
ncbi:MAG TPA: tail fiber domain-containing protein, partial [Dehalococcoidia bacterium]|nr:tail fiber domain-containing protein [Dehalococcoidia bacterium]